MESDEIRDGRSVIPRVDKREVVRTHLRQSVSVLINERSLKNRISRSTGVERDNGASSRSSNCRGGGSIVRPFRLAGSVSNGEEQNFDGMRESDIERLLLVRSRSESRARCSLNLFN
jgi:hypothetical protein